jgi:hypothetical protein
VRGLRRILKSAGAPSPDVVADSTTSTSPLRGEVKRGRRDSIQSNSARTYDA